MKLNANRGKAAVLDSGAAILGAVASHALIVQGEKLLTQHSPNSGLANHLPALVLAAVLGVQAFGVSPANNDAINSAMLGATVTAGIGAVRQYTGANTATETSTGVSAIVAKYVPALSGVGEPVYDYTETPRQLQMTQPMPAVNQLAIAAPQAAYVGPVNEYGVKQTALRTVA